MKYHVCSACKHPSWPRYLSPAKDDMVMGCPCDCHDQATSRYLEGKGLAGRSGTLGVFNYPQGG